MVDEALVAWLLPKLPSELGSESDGGDEVRLRALLSFASRSHDFSSAQVVR